MHRKQSITLAPLRHDQCAQVFVPGEIALVGQAADEGAVSQLSGLPSLFVRKQPKTYGTCRLAEGGEVAGRRLVVVEDVVSSGGQAVASCRALRELGAEIAAVVCLLDRESGGGANIAAEGLELRSVFTMTQVRAAANA